jgi:hypothetical protein
VHKRLPFYYIVTLWTVAIVSVFLIVKPLLLTITDQNNFAFAADPAFNSPIADNAALIENGKKEKADSNSGDDLFFYNKTSFIRYFSDKYPEQELAVSYTKAFSRKADIDEKSPIRVIRKIVTENSKNSFSGGFDIRPVPVSNK